MGALMEPLKSAAPTAVESERSIASIGQAEVRAKGKPILVPSVEVDGRTVIAVGKWLKVAEIRHEDLVEGDTVANPESFVSQLLKSGLRADLFTFAQRLPDTVPKYTYRTEWENVAAIPITKYSDWWQIRAEYSIRKAVNRAKKVGVVARVTEFNDEFVEAVCRIYGQSPVRQGKAFWHYKKDFQTLKHELGDYLDRSIFIGAYCQDELIGSMKIISVNSTATIAQIFCAQNHFNKRPNNALIAKAIEICEAHGKSHFIYGSFVYYDATSTLTEFKRRNGFEPVLLPRYYIPLTVKGKIALTLGLHRGIAANTPKPILKQFLRFRRLWFTRSLKAIDKAA
jgi:hypothetical protein